MPPSVRHSYKISADAIPICGADFCRLLIIIDTGICLDKSVSVGSPVSEFTYSGVVTTSGIIVITGISRHCIFFCGFGCMFRLYQSFSLVSASDL